MLPLSPTDRTHAQQAYDESAQAIAAYEIGAEVSSFTSRFDAFLAGTANMTAAQSRGYDLFRGKANCNTCHLDGRSNTQAAGETDNGMATNAAPLFTDFTYNGIGLPMNLAFPWYSENHPDQFGFTRQSGGSCVPRSRRRAIPRFVLRRPAAEFRFSRSLSASSRPRHCAMSLRYRQPPPVGTLPVCL